MSTNTIQTNTLASKTNGEMMRIASFHCLDAVIDDLTVTNVTGLGVSSTSVTTTIEMTVATNMWDPFAEGSLNSSTVNIVFTRVGKIVTAYFPGIFADNTTTVTGSQVFINLYPTSTSLEDEGLSPGGYNGFPYNSVGGFRNGMVYDGNQYNADMIAMNVSDPDNPMFNFFIIPNITNVQAGKSVIIAPFSFTYFTN